MEQIRDAFALSFHYIKKYPQFWIYVVLRFITTFATTSIPLIVGYVIFLLTNHQPLERIYPWVGVLFLILLVSPLLDKMSFINGWYISFRAAHDFRLDAVKRLRHTGLSFWQDHDRGKIMKIIDQSFEHFVYLSGSIINSYIPFIGRMIGIFIGATFIDPVIGALLFIDAVLFGINTKILLPKESTAGIRERKAQESVYGRINEYLTNYKTIVYLNLFSRQDNEVQEYNDIAYKAYQGRESISGLKWYFNSQIHGVCTTIIILYGLYQVISGHLQIGFLTTLVFFALQIGDFLNEGTWQISELVKYANSINRYTETFKGVHESYSEMPDITIDFKYLQFERVSLQQKDRETLRNINLTVKKGEKVAIVGYTGSGKTTFIDIILKAITHYDGKISINEYDYENIHVQDIAKVYSIVPQEVQLFQGSVKENIAINNYPDEKQLEKVIHVACLDSLIEKLPKGIESHIHEGASNVSGGERQRIGIARSLLQNHPVLILDEATASLDPKTERDVITNIIHSYPDMTMLYITHKYSLLNLFDHILVMNDGFIIEQGSFHDLVDKGGLFKDLFDASQMQ